MESSTHPDTSLPGSSYVIEQEQDSGDTMAVEMVQQLSSQKEKDEEPDAGNIIVVSHIQKEKDEEPDAANIIVVSRTESKTNLDEQDKSKPKRRVSRTESLIEDVKDELIMDCLFFRLMCGVCCNSFPFGALVGLSLASAGCIYMLNGLNTAAPVLSKYMPDETKIIVSSTELAVAAIVLVNCFVLFQGVAIFVIQSQRKCCGKTRTGCSR